MHDILLVINAGSSSLKFHVYDLREPDTLSFAYGGQLSGIGGAHPDFTVRDAAKAVLVQRDLRAAEAPDLAAAQKTLGDWLGTKIHRVPRAVGHRIVHGGPQFADSVLVSDDVLRYLETLVPLAPLHQRNNLAPVRVIHEQWPDILQVACFDTAFHRTHDKVVERFALPQSFYDRGVRRYGFHGLSYDYIAQRLRRDMPEVARGRVVAAHLGSGASACAMLDGRSVESTMGFTALDGLPMATRPGRLDPGVVLWMLEQGMSHDEIQHLLYNESGLKGLSGISADIRDLQASDAPSAQLALDYFAYRVAESIAGLCVAIKGLDTLVFTAGIGEHSAPARSSICGNLAWLGIELDEALNQANAPCISAARSPIAVHVLPTNEELVIAQQTLRAISAGKR
ncbi:MAG: acetate/propionate family kinase [Pollutimonas bauzanensis]|uniref:Acetate kinase n=1 Tax=Pollutimonas bauzanensis TaxID=658167 RepID=A0A1M5WLG3_9BURK|nr:acetate/propionate family kinase [Pollutimonas bauzanensis]SHH87873.1 acetate kinase [Pollutimonas bauzanensis]